METILQPHQLQEENIPTFIFGGFAVFTVVNNKSGNRFTYRIKFPYQKDENGKATKKLDRSGIMFVSVLTGADMHSYIGYINKDRNFIHGKTSRISQNAPSVQVISKLISILKEGHIPKSANIYHEGKCGRCNRPLTVPSSIVSGIGPTCATK